MINVSDKATGKIYTQVNTSNELQNWILTEGVKLQNRNIVFTETKRKNQDELKK